MFGGVESSTDSGKSFIVVVSDRKKETLRDIIYRRVAPGSIIVTDCWKSYDFLDEDIHFEHYTVNHSSNFVDPTTGHHTQRVEGMWSVHKRSIPSTSRRSSNIQSLLFESAFRMKCRADNRSFFWAMIQVIFYSILFFSHCI